MMVQVFRKNKFDKFTEYVTLSDTSEKHEHQAEM